jgi:hypothetical protein
MDWYDIIFLALFAALYIFFITKVLPRFGVPT